MTRRGSIGGSSSRSSTPTATAGFTLVELLVAALIGSVLMAAVYQVLVTNQRISIVQREQVLSQQTIRAGLDVLAQELREVSAGGGDLLEAAEQRVRFRALRAFGIACVIDEPRIRVAPFTRPFQGRPDIYVFADGNPLSTDDDEWLVATLQELPQDQICPGVESLPAQRLILQGLSSAQFARIRVGAPVRSFQTVAYHVESLDGELYLVRTLDDVTARLVGPLDPESGLAFEYLDGNGQPTAVLPNVRRVRITLRTVSGVRTEDGQQVVADSLTTTVFLRN